MIAVIIAKILKATPSVKLYSDAGYAEDNISWMTSPIPPKPIINKIFLLIGGLDEDTNP
ncbi:hypothetical protein [Nitrosopumilus sp. Nsub]|uniref:hypothetical protein n=1 Tax=Nitrosopumilus sp. Nsub TaxID=1776294 RepID=UPI000B2142DA|nr:hypothetical protein [Nitrosopumilus sp. Nsub]